MIIYIIMQIILLLIIIMKIIAMIVEIKLYIEMIVVSDIGNNKMVMMNRTLIVRMAIKRILS